MLEVIQNAADNSYADGCQPELRFVLRSSYMETECNEVGFSADNVRAFCGIGQSTKKNQAGYIGAWSQYGSLSSPDRMQGEKGIGEPR